MVTWSNLPWVASVGKVRSGTAEPPAAALAREIATHPHGRVPADLRREHILLLAGELFAERGYAQASMDELARRAGVSKPVIYDLVGAKEEVLRRVVARVSDDLAERLRLAVQAESEPDRRIHAGALAYFRFVAETGAAYTMVVGSLGGELAEEVASSRARIAELVTDLTAEGMREAGLDPDPVQAEALAHLLAGALESLSLWWVRHPERTADELADLVTALVSPGLVALAADPPRW